jgi:acetolactate synthase-1/2/3 large subunit
MEKRMISGARAMVDSLLKEGVDTVFGYPGATIAPFYDCLSSSPIRHILTRSEQGAGHAASGYARITGRPGICVATSGPGATNLFTAIATAYSDSIPLVAITGQVATYQLGRDVFQEVDTTGAVEPFTKYTYLVKNAADIPRVFKEAFHIASTGRKGPVLIDMPVDIQQQELSAFTYPRQVDIRSYKPGFEGHALQVRRVADAIAASERPLICAGGGVFSSGAQRFVQTFCEQSGIPLVSTMMGIGVLPAHHPLFFGMLGQSGSIAANRAVRDSDLLVLVGARVGDRAIVQPARLEANATIVHIDIDPAEIGKNVGTTIPLVGDAANVMAQLTEKNIRGDWRAWTDSLESLRQKERKSAEMKKSRPGFIEPGAFIRTLCRMLPEKSVYVADVGLNQIWSARNFSAAGRFLTTGGMGTMGYAVPAAIGAKLADQTSTVVAVCGDGAFQMSMNELATLCQHDVPVKIIIMRNGNLGMVRDIQDRAYKGNRVAVDLAGSPDFGVIADAYGISHARIDSDADAGDAIRLMLETDGPYLLECAVDEKEGL